VSQPTNPPIRGGPNRIAKSLTHQKVTRIELTSFLAQLVNNLCELNIDSL